MQLGDPRLTQTDQGAPGSQKIQLTERALPAYSSGVLPEPILEGFVFGRNGGSGASPYVEGQGCLT